jgi:hypothetical protein
MRIGNPSEGHEQIPSAIAQSVEYICAVGGRRCLTRPRKTVAWLRNPLL